jgi:hypothetical protein
VGAEVALDLLGDGGRELVHAAHDRRSRDVQALLGRPPRSFANFVADHAGRFTAQLPDPASV